MNLSDDRTPLYCTPAEGGYWITWDNPESAHALLYEGGDRWDGQNGWDRGAYSEKEMCELAALVNERR